VRGRIGFAARDWQWYVRMRRKGDSVVVWESPSFGRTFGPLHLCGKKGEEYMLEAKPGERIGGLEDFRKITVSCLMFFMSYGYNAYILFTSGCIDWRKKIKRRISEEEGLLNEGMLDRSQSLMGSALRAKCI
jgi:hypothetical protein